MSIRGTSNQSIKSVEQTVVSEGFETGPDSGGGGAGNPQDGSNEYREVDNASPGVTFIKGSRHLPDGDTQVTTVI